MLSNVYVFINCSFFFFIVKQIILHKIQIFTMFEIFIKLGFIFGLIINKNSVTEIKMSEQSKYFN